MEEHNDKDKLVRLSSLQRRLLLLAHHLLPGPHPSLSSPLHKNTVTSSYAHFEVEMGEPVVIGGMVLDIQAKPYSTPMPGTTTPGMIEYTRGGVARNIAECMATLGSKPFIISVLGHDMAGNMLLKHWTSLGLATEGIVMPLNTTTPVVMNIYDASGELASAVACVEAVEKCLSISWVEQFRCKIRSSPILLVDANLHPQILKIACEMAANYGVPVWFEPVSVIKAARVAPVVKYVTFSSPNEHELITMANSLSPGSKFYSYNGLNENGEKLSYPEAIAQQLQSAICFLLDEGIRILVVTLGSNGVLVCSRADPNFMKVSIGKARSSNLVQLYKLVNGSCSSHHIVNSIRSRRQHHAYALYFPALPASVVSLTGAGDCFVGGALASICSGLDLVQSMAVAVSVAKAAVEVKSNIPPDFSLNKIAGEAKLVCSDAKIFELS